MKQYKKDIILEAPGASMAALTSTSNTSTVKSSFSEHDIIYAGSVAEPSYIPPVDSSESAMIGEWIPVTPPPAPQEDQVNDESTSQEVIPQYDEEEEEDPDDLRNFKVVEKTFPLEDSIKDEDSSKVTFKKRKFAGQGKTRNIRKKTS